MYAVEMRKITKRFGSFTANDQIDFLVKKGEIHCLLGENGAGKTTLMNVLFGLYKADEGELKINGKEIKKHSARNAFQCGLGMVHQHFMLVDALTVWENVVIGNEPGKFSINKKDAVKKVQELSDKYHFDLNAEAKVADLSIGMKQRVEILKTLYRGAEILILDEPTAVLTPQEVLELLDIFRDIRKQGKTIIFITHKLNETKAVSDSLTVLRAGKSAVIGIVLKQKENTAVSVIGGADGPTSIFIAGKLNGDNFIFMIVVGIILLILAGVIFYKRKH